MAENQSQLARSENEAKSTQPPAAPRLDGFRVLVLFGGSELFGQERADLEVLRALRELGLEAKFVISWKWGRQQIQPELKRSGFAFIEAPFGYLWGKGLLGRRFWQLFANLYGILATSWRIFWETRRWKATHLYASNWTHFLYAAPAVALLRLPLLFRAGDELPMHSAFHRKISRSLFRRVACFVCNAVFLQHRLTALGVPASRLRVIYNQPPRRSPQGPTVSPSAPAGACVLLYIGQVTTHKGVPELVEAVVALLKKGRNIVLWIAGGSRWEDKLTCELKEKGRQMELAQTIHFLGYLENIPDLFRHAHIHVWPSTWNEPSPNVIFEAKQESVPTVAFRVGGIPELIEHKINGYLCVQKTAEALAEGIDYFVTHPSERLKAGKAARRSLEEKFSYERFRREWAEVFLRTSVGTGES